MTERSGIFEDRTKDKAVGRQIILPWSKAIEISMKSLRTRFWRSMITMSGIILAIAFLMSVWTSTDFINSFKSVGRDDPNFIEVRNVLLRQRVDLAEAEGMEAKDIWLVSLSLLVCVVGIVNAMLMSVTERIREIGTMKCLGALNGFIIKLFLLESSLQGITGTVLGIAIGFLLAFLRVLVSYGGFTFRYFPVVDVAAHAVLALLIGSLLSVFAAIFPAQRAAAMQPVDALRSEE